MQEQLFLNGIELDLEPLQIERSVRVSDIADITAKKSSISTQFKLRRTAKNDAALNMLGSPGNTSRVPYTENRINYTVNTLPVVVNGFMNIERTDKDFHYVRIFDGLVNLAAALDGKLLRDLPLADLDHYLNGQTFEDSFVNTSGFIYAYADFGQGTGKVEFIAPSFYVHTLWDRIFSSLGVQYEGEFFSSDTGYLAEVITPAIGYVPQDVALSVTDKGEATSDTITRNESSAVFFSKEDEHNFTDIDLVSVTIASGNLVSGISGRLQLNITSAWDNIDTDLEVRVKVNGVNKATIPLGAGSNQSLVTPVILPVEAGDIISMTVRGVSSYDINGGDSQIFELNYEVSNDVQINEVSGGMFVQASAIIGKMTQIEFIKDVMSRFGLFVTPIPGNTEAYRFKQVNNLLQESDEAIDWTDKLIDAGEESYDPSTSRRNNFKFKYVKDVVDFKNDGVLEVDNFNLPLESDMYSSPFEIPERSLTLNSQPIYSRNLFELKDSVIIAKEAPNSLLSVNRVNGSITLQFFSDASIPFTGDIPYLSLEPINMQAYINRNYPQYNALLNDYRERECSLNLSTSDIFNVRFDRLYYFAQLGRYFILNELRHKALNIVKGVFTQVGEFAANEAPETVGDYTFSMSKQGTKTLTLANLTEGYFDKEYDAAKAVRILSGWGNEIEIQQGGVEITAQTDILVEDLDLKIVDTSLSTSERSHSFTFTLSDIGSGEFSADTGTISVTVLEYTPAAVFALAGADKALEIDPSLPYAEANVFVTGAASHSDDEIASYTWSIISAPAGSSAYFDPQTDSNPAATINIPNDVSSAGAYTLRLTVISEFGESDTDDLVLTVTTA